MAARLAALAGLTLILAGVALIYAPIALILAGVALVRMAVMAEAAEATDGNTPKELPHDS